MHACKCQLYSAQYQQRSDVHVFDVQSVTNDSSSWHWLIRAVLCAKLLSITIVLISLDRRIKAIGVIQESTQ
jgi:hypothetical protein